MLFNTASPAFEKPIPLYILLPLHPFVQADMLSACIEYEDILSDKQRGAHPSPPKGREPERGSVFSNRLTSNRGYSPLPSGGTGGGLPLPSSLEVAPQGIAD